MWKQGVSNSAKIMKYLKPFECLGYLSLQTYTFQTGKVHICSLNWSQPRHTCLKKKTHFYTGLFQTDIYKVFDYL